MTLITLQDGKVVMRDGKVGTEQACCCNPPCQCSAYSSNFSEPVVNPACQIDYITFDVEIFFPESTGNVLAAQVTLDGVSGGLNNTPSIVLIPDPAFGCDYEIRAQLFCATFSNNFGAFNNHWAIAITVIANSCGVLCPAVASFLNLMFPMGTVTTGGACCPDSIAADLTVTEPSGGGGVNPCPGWYVKISNMTVVLL